jgi:hypothetical protein
MNELKEMQVELMKLAALLELWRAIVSSSS